MTFYKPMTPQMRRDIDRATDKAINELSECQNTPYVEMLKSLYEIQRNVLNSFPDGFLIPFEERR